MRSEEKILYRLWLSSIPGVGRKIRNKLRMEFGDDFGVYTAAYDDIAKISGDEKADKIYYSKGIDRVHKLLEKYKSRDIDIICPWDERYPRRLLDIDDAPDILYYQGKYNDIIQDKNNCIGIVGSRMNDSYGKEISYRISYDLASKNICIISGLARGIDSFSHEGALDAGGYTVGVLGCGINVTYPREKINLFCRMRESGLIISEYGLDVPPENWHFPERNRIISGLSDGVLVVQAKEKSGSLITVDFALEQGKQVYAIPGRLYDPNSAGTNNLIRQGACCVTNANDIIFDIQGIYEDDSCALADKKLLAPAEKIVYSCLSLEPKSIDVIVAECRLPVSEAINILYNMEANGVIKQPDRGYYIITI